MFALISDDKVVQLSDTIFTVNPALKWVDASDSVKEGFTFDGSTFNDPKASLEAEKLLAQTTPSPKYTQYRQEDYIKEGLTFERWNELVIEGGIVGQDDFKARREIIRLRYEKPI